MIITDIGDNLAWHSDIEEEEAEDAHNSSVNFFVLRQGDTVKINMFSRARHFPGKNSFLTKSIVAVDN